MKKERRREPAETAMLVAILIDEPERDAPRRGITIKQPTCECVGHGLLEANRQGRKERQGDVSVVSSIENKNLLAFLAVYF